MRVDAKVPKKRGRGRPKINPDNIIDSVDMLNLKEKGTQYSKNIKIKESTFFILHDLKENDSSLKSIDDVIMKLIVAFAMVQYENKDDL